MLSLLSNKSMEKLAGSSANAFAAARPAGPPPIIAILLKRTMANATQESDVVAN